MHRMSDNKQEGVDSLRRSGPDADVLDQGAHDGSVRRPRDRAYRTNRSYRTNGPV
jgi:hypothetical protein